MTANRFRLHQCLACVLTLSTLAPTGFALAKDNKRTEGKIDISDVGVYRSELKKYILDLNTIIDEVSSLSDEALLEQYFINLEAAERVETDQRAEVAQILPEAYRALLFTKDGSEEKVPFDPESSVTYTALMMGNYFNSLTEVIEKGKGFTKQVTKILNVNLELEKSLNSDQLLRLVKLCRMRIALLSKGKIVVEDQLCDTDHDCIMQNKWRKIYNDRLNKIVTVIDALDKKVRKTQEQTYELNALGKIGLANPHLIRLKGEFMQLAAVLNLGLMISQYFGDNENGFFAQAVSAFDKNYVLVENRYDKALDGIDLEINLAFPKE